MAITGLVAVLTVLLFSVDVKGLVKGRVQYSGEAATCASGLAAVSPEFVSGSTGDFIDPELTQHISGYWSYTKESSNPAQGTQYILSILAGEQDIYKTASRSGIIQNQQICDTGFYLTKCYENPEEDIISAYRSTQVITDSGISQYIDKQSKN